MGRVYLAEDAVLARPVAIKFIAGVEPDLEARQRFLMEARAAARIQHPNVVGVYRVGELDDRPYIVSEFVRGKSLAEHPLPIPWLQVVAIAIDLARGLAAAHRRGVVHCDIKPGNAMVTDEGVAKLVDFGLSRVSHEGSEDAAGPMIGTPDFMAPEVWGGRSPSRRSDVYSFGAVLFALIAGKTPFGEVEPRDLADAVRGRPAPELRERVPDVDIRLSRLVARCLERDPALRFASGEDLREALEQLHPSRLQSVRTDVNPYRGLRTFEAAHRGLFFGRGFEVSAIVERLRTDSIVIVTGDSGVGKSSLLRAGVVPAVLDGALGAGRTWESITMLPGRRPLAALAIALGDPAIAARVLEDPESLPRELHQRAGDRGMLLFIDQMEELVTVGDPAEVAALDIGLARISEGMPGIRLVTTVRADFLSRIASLPRLGRELSRLLFFVSPLPPERIRDVITGPALATGVQFESEDMIGSLVESTADTGSGGLPLLSFALAELWEARDRERAMITQAALDTMGGVAGALARHGDAVLASMPATDRSHARRILLRLVTSLGTRVRRTEAELSVGGGTRTVLDALVKGRLLVVHDGDDGATFELAHEVLVGGWGTLREWLDADAMDRARRERLAIATAEWNRVGRRADMTWRGPRLVEARALDGANLTALEKDFIVASMRAAQRRLWIRRGGIVAVLALLVVGYLVQRHVAQTRLADAVAIEVDAARTFIETARTTDREQQTLAAQAYARFDAGDTAAGEAAWQAVEAKRTAAEKAYRTAAERIEAALAKDPTRDDVRTVLGDILLERAVLADLVHDRDRRDELLERLAAYDADGTRRARWAAPGRLVVHAPATELVLEPGHRTLGTGDASLEPGSYVVLASAPGREPVRAPVLIERGKRVELDLTLPRTGSVPPGFIFVPTGAFLYGSAADAATRGNFDTVPLHPRTTPAFLIARTEATIAEWLTFVDAQPEAARAALLPNLPSKFGGSVVIDRFPDGAWRFAFQPLKRSYVARWGEPVEYTGRDRRARADWSRFPITGISARDAEQYAAWLDRTGRVPGARLCNELEWEHAARGADGRIYPAGDHLDPDDINVDTTYTRDLMGFDEVGAHPTSTSPFGLVDMSGNAFEWTVSERRDAYIARGGSCYYDRNTANLANRTAQIPEFHDATLGVRMCATPKPE